MGAVHFEAALGTSKKRIPPVQVVQSLTLLTVPQHRKVSCPEWSVWVKQHGCHQTLHSKVNPAHCVNGLVWNWELHFEIENAVREYLGKLEKEV